MPIWVYDILLEALDRGDLELKKTGSGLIAFRLFMVNSCYEKKDAACFAEKAQFGGLSNVTEMFSAFYIIQWVECDLITGFSLGQ